MNTLTNPIPIWPDSLPVQEISCKTPAGFPSPAQDLAVNRIDLNDILIQHHVSTLYKKQS
ncbi:MAG: hypothetical protein RBR37_11110 [Advenella sp.]|nr:hypothetical protein [Advenella sp.]